MPNWVIFASLGIFVLAVLSHWAAFRLGLQRGVKAGQAIGVQQGQNLMARHIWNQMSAVGRTMNINIDNNSVHIQTTKITPNVSNQDNAKILTLPPKN